MGIIRQGYYDAFLSYAHDDNILNGGPIPQFRSLLKMNFEAAMRQRVSSVSPADIFMDQRGLPTNGDLTTEIEKAIGYSIFLFIFVGKSYPRSQWCGKELRLFSEQFAGDRKRALVERTWIIVLERDATESAKQLASSDHFGRTDAIFVELFDKTDGTALPILVENEEGLAVQGPRFTKRFRPIIETMALRADGLMHSA
jgi:hypothetical protein